MQSLRYNGRTLPELAYTKKPKTVMDGAFVKELLMWIAVPCSNSELQLQEQCRSNPFGWRLLTELSIMGGQRTTS